MRWVAKEYSTWCRMKSRCFNHRFIQYDDYGGRGITVCAKWRHDYLQFLSDVGRAPSPNHSLERINNDGHYEPGNCRWATPSEQARNRRSSQRITVNGESVLLIDVANAHGVNYHTLYTAVIVRKERPEDVIARRTPAGPRGLPIARRQ